jgi:hypothetical protein
MQTTSTGGFALVSTAPFCRVCGGVLPGQVATGTRACGCSHWHVGAITVERLPGKRGVAPDVKRDPCQEGEVDVV